MKFQCTENEDESLKIQVYHGAHAHIFPLDVFRYLQIFSNNQHPHRVDVKGLMWKN
jgi:hypothetical protein